MREFTIKLPAAKFPTFPVPLVDFSFRLIKEEKTPFEEVVAFRYKVGIKLVL